jgi:2-amino-4-hydroxy-6-hydroxymethyldihydropteridine diphosphokinase
LKNNLVYIALGSNLNNPMRQIEAAVQRLKQLPHSVLEKLSSCYLSPPLGPADQPDFINCVAALTTSFTPEQLLDHLQNIEHEQGRVRTLRWGPRTIDLDILLYDDQIIQTPRLTIPHCELTQRAFFIFPLFEIAPQLILPDGQALIDLKNRLFPGVDPYAENSCISRQF